MTKINQKSKIPSLAEAKPRAGKNQKEKPAKSSVKKSSRKSQKEPQTMDELLVQSKGFLQGVKKGDTVEGIVASISPREVFVDIGELWQFLYDKFLYYFPQACSEALHISAESVERPKQGSYKFSSKGDLS